MAKKRARTALVSGGLEPVADDGAGGHSVFANALLGVLRESDGILDGQTLAKQVTQKVVLGAEQTPQYSDIRRGGHDGGEFLFVPQGSTVVVVPPSEGRLTDERTLELAFWQSIAGSTNHADFVAYLAKYPEGEFAPLARNRLQSLAETKTAMVEPPKAAFQVAEMDAVMVTLKRTNVRDGPTTKSTKVATLDAGAIVSVTGKVEDADWHRIERKEGEEGFVYAPLLGAEVPERAQARAPGDDAAELALWEQINGSDNPAMLRAYLERFPEGLFAGVATARIEELEGKQAALVAPPIPSTGVTGPIRADEGGVGLTVQGCQIYMNHEHETRSTSRKGGCVDGKAQGHGEFTWDVKWDDGKVVVETYRGTWRAGRLHGEGTYSDTAGNRYEGNYKDGLAHGQGISENANGYRYEGTFRNGKKDGRGIQEDEDGTRYEGSFRNGKTHGRGVLTSTEGWRYEGLFKAGAFHGRGKFHFSVGGYYEGTFDDGVIDGSGIKVLPNGSRYEGEFKQAKENGIGTMTFDDGDRYVGGWQDGEKHGHGKYSFASGSSCEGEWADGDLVGTGKGWKDGSSTTCYESGNTIHWGGGSTEWNDRPERER
jgi:SH3-like domain-containing protein